jgi:peroxidase
MIPTYPEVRVYLIMLHVFVLYRLKTREITNYLFEVEPGTGTDLIALNINRARDHGVPPYMEFRKVCGLSTTNTFRGLTDHTDETIRRFRNIYE